MRIDAPPLRRRAHARHNPPMPTAITRRSERFRRVEAEREATTDGVHDRAKPKRPDLCNASNRIDKREQLLHFRRNKIVPIRMGLPAHLAATLGPTQRRADGPADRHHMAGGHMGRGTGSFCVIATAQALSKKQARVHRRTSSSHRLRRQHVRAAKARTLVTGVRVSHASSASAQQTLTSRAAPH